MIKKLKEEALSNSCGWTLIKKLNGIFLILYLKIKNNCLGLHYLELKITHQLLF